MRLFVTLAVAASIGLAACSGGSQSIPASSQLAPPMERSIGQLTPGHVEPLAKCPKAYLLCVAVSNTKAGKYEICVSSTGKCTSGSFPTEVWSSKITTLKGKKFRGIVAKFKPNPGNPTIVTLTAKVKLPNSHGRVDFIQIVTACHTKTSCMSGKVGIETV